MDNIYVAAQVDFRTALEALVRFVMQHDDPKDYCPAMAERLHLAATVIENRLKPENED